MNPLRSAVLALLVCGVTLGAGVAVAGGTYHDEIDPCTTGSTYEMTIAGCVDTPDRTVTLEGDEYNVSGIGVVSPGETISASVDAPSDASYTVYLYTSSGNIEDFDDSAEPQFDTDDLSAGSYMLALKVDGSTQTVYPVIIRSYKVSIDAPATAEPGEEVQLTVSVEKVSGTSKQLEKVELVVSNDGTDERLPATKQSDGTYTVTTSFDEPGEWHVYANARGTDDVNGHKELIGASSSKTVDVAEQTATETETETETDNENENKDDDENKDENENTDKNEDENESNSAPPDSNSESPTETGTQTATSTETATATDTAESETVTETESNVITPETEDSEDSETSTDGSLGVATSIAAIVLVAFLLRRH